MRVDSWQIRRLPRRSKHVTELNYAVSTGGSCCSPEQYRTEAGRFELEDLVVDANAQLIRNSVQKRVGSRRAFSWTRLGKYKCSRTSMRAAYVGRSSAQYAASPARHLPVICTVRCTCVFATKSHGIRPRPSRPCLSLLRG